MKRKHEVNSIEIFKQVKRGVNVPIINLNMESLALYCIRHNLKMEIESSGKLKSWKSFLKAFHVAEHKGSIKELLNTIALEICGEFKDDS